ncbi:MAG: peptidase U32 family protein [Nanoarchaeota archaeon]|nr:peptidase U32 family protein [Nanoarchaeota archaeon]
MENKNKKVELLLPAGNEVCLRAAVNNGADAVYLGMNKFNARQSASNFNENNISRAISYCHKRNVKVYIALNTLIKNHELQQYFELMAAAYSEEADAVIIQDPCFIPIIKKNFPGLKIHLSTQATVVNSYSIPKNIERVILARELSIDEIQTISSGNSTEVFVHGALCFSYSGQCLFSSVVGSRSGNRGMCAQPCRKRYNNKYNLSTMDLCMLEKIPELIKAGVSSFKIEGRLRSPVYIATAARIYRKYIDLYYDEKNNSEKNNEKKNSKFVVDEKDIDDLKIAFNREFTTGFAFGDNIVDTRKPMNRGLYIGQIRQGLIHLKKDIKVGDGISFWLADEVIGQKVNSILKQGTAVKQASAGDIIDISAIKKARDMKDIQVYKTSSVDMKIYLGDEISLARQDINKLRNKNKIMIPQFKKQKNKDQPRIFVKTYNKKSALEADKAKADIVYYDILKQDCHEVKGLLKHSRFFVYTPRIVSDNQINDIVRLIENIRPDGVLVSNKGLLKSLSQSSLSLTLHLDYSFNCFNDIDLSCYQGIPICSPELNFNEMSALKNKRFIAMAHGDIELMTTKQRLVMPELIDDESKHFKVREAHGVYEILNCRQLGLFNHIRDYLEQGIKYFYMDISKDVGKYVRIYRKILNLEPFDDRKISKGYTLGHLKRGVD